ncbi:MAG: hypothetical protein ACRD3W_31365, partial [Terriglobales bacterium]
WNASEQGALQKVTDTEKDPKEMYIVANSVTYTDPLYLEALDKLLKEKKLKQSGDEDDRQTFCRVETECGKSQGS